MQEKYLTGLTMFSTGLTGILVGSLILGKPDFNTAMAVENSKTAPVVQRIEQSTSKTNVADKLSNDFISVSKNVYVISACDAVFFADDVARSPKNVINPFTNISSLSKV